MSLFYRLKLYIEQFRKRRGDADTMWVAMLVGFSAQQQKIIKMHSKLQENKLVRLSSLEVQPVCIPMRGYLSVKDRTLLWVNIMLALLEDVPMLSLTFAYVLRQGAQAEKPVFIVSMMMSAGAIYLKFGGLIYFPLLADQKKHLENQIASKAANWLSAEDRNALEQHGIRIKCAKADNSTGGVLN